MSDILPVGGTASVSVALPVKESVLVSASESSQPTEADQVEISELAQMLSGLDNDQGIRTEKVAAIREAILNGTYETEDKLDYAINRLLDILTSNT